MKILFVGDFVLEDEKSICVENNLQDFINDHDFKLCNFEGAIKKDSDIPIQKVGPHVFNGEMSPKILQNLGVNIVTLANNHIMDFGSSALERTINNLSENGIRCIGAGMSYKEAYKPLILGEKNKKKVAFINACQAEFGVCKNIFCKAGYAWILNPEIKKMIQECAKECDEIIVLPHAGLEDVIFPLPEWKNVYHELIDEIVKHGKRGFVIASHPHIVQGIEYYKDSPIVYSLGNFYFWKESLRNNNEWNRSIVVSLDTDNNKFLIKRISCKDGKLSFSNSESFINDIEERNKILLDSSKLEKKADELAEELWKQYYCSYYVSLEKSISDLSFFDLIKEFVRRILVRKNKTEAVNETLLLHNLQIETHKWIVERYLYNFNCRNNKFL